MATHYCRPSDIITAATTLSLTAGTADADYPLTNAKDRLAHTVFKSTGTGCTIRSTWAGNVTLEGLAIINHKLAGATATITNAAGFNQSFPIPANSEDGHCLDPWLSFLGLSNRTDDVWDLAITGAATVCAIGEIVWIQTLRTLALRADPAPEQDEAHPSIIHPTDYGVRQKYSLGVRQRALRGRVTKETARADILALQRDAEGAFSNFLLVPESGVNDALYVDLRTDVRSYLRRAPNVSEVALEFLEQQKGLAL